MKALETFNYPHSLLLILRTHYQSLLPQSNTYSIKIHGDVLQIQGTTTQAINEASTLLKQQLLETLHYVEIFVSSLPQRQNFVESPRRSLVFAQNDCQVSIGTEYVYISSLTKTEEEIRKIASSFQKEDIWNFPFKNLTHTHWVYKLITAYFRKEVKRKQQVFASKNVDVEVAKSGWYFLIRGKSSCQKMWVKNTLKLMVYSVATLEVKTLSTEDQYKKLNTYFSKITDHPVVISKPEGGVSYLVTKDSIVKEIMGKDKFLKFLDPNRINEMGLFVLEKNSEREKKSIVNNAATKMQWYVNEKSSFFYFTDSMSTSQNPHSNLDLMKTVLKALIHNKPTFDLSQKTPKHSQSKSNPNPNPKKEDTSNIFYQEGEQQSYQDTLPLSRRFGCDIRVKIVYLNPNYLKKFDSIEGTVKENVMFSLVEWCPSEQVRVFEVGKGMSGKYFFGKMKEWESGTMYCPSSTVELI